MRVNYSQAMARAVQESLQADPKVFLIGSTFAGLSAAGRAAFAPVLQEFAGRIMAAPVSELGLVGAAIGAALSGSRPLMDVGAGSFAFQALGADRQRGAQHPLHERRPDAGSSHVLLPDRHPRRRCGPALPPHPGDARQRPGAATAVAGHADRRLRHAEMGAAGKRQPYGLSQPLAAARRRGRGGLRRADAADRQGPRRRARGAT